MKNFVIAIAILLLAGSAYAQEEGEENPGAETTTTETETDESSLMSQDVTSYDAGELRSRKQLKLAKKLERDGSFINAIIYYERSYEVRPKKKTLFSLANLNRQIRDYNDAEKWYKKLTTDYEDKYKDSRFYLALMMKHNEKYTEAMSQFDRFLKAYDEKDKETFKKIVENEVEGCKQAEDIFANPTKNEIKILGDDVNTFGPEFSPRPYGEEKMVYAAIKTDSAINVTKSTFSYFSRFFETTKSEEDWENSKIFAPGTSEEGYHSANLAFNPDRSWMYYTRCGSDREEVNQCDIYRVEKIANGWGSPEEMSGINQKGYTSTHPAIGVDPEGNEVLYFASNRTGGQGGLDIWYAVKKGDRFGSPKNMGAKFNTARDEVTPFFDNENQIFYFSSNGHPGIGGLDIFSVPGNLKQWEDTIINEGIPLNSSADDFYLAVNDEGEDGFFVSNREGSKSLKGKTTGDDVYNVKLQKDCPLVIKGYITDCNDPQRLPIADVEVSLYKVMSDKNFEYVTSMITTEDELFYLNVEPNTQYKINSIKDGYWPSVEEMTTPEDYDCDTVFQLICIKPIEKKIKVRNVYFAFDESDMVDLYKDEMDSIYDVMVEYTTYMCEIGGHTDSKGSESYNIVLSKKRAKAAAEYLIKLGVEEERLITKGYGESQPIAPNENPDGSDNPIGRQKNRRVEFKIIKEIEDEIVIEYIENEPEEVQDRSIR